MTQTPKAVGRRREAAGRGAPGAATGRPGALEEILESVRHDLAAKKGRLSQDALETLALGRAPCGDAFAAALARPDRINVIAECKWRSPSRGTLRAEYQPGRIAQAYRAAGAAAVSVLTEPRFFGGTVDHLREVSGVIDLPVLQKDFIIDEYQLLEARAVGADAVLLIASALDTLALGHLVVRARQLGLAALVEVHNEADLERALETGAAIVGINNRDLRTLRVDLATSTTLIRRIPAGVAAVAESGIESRDTLVLLRDCGFHAFLIGGHLMSSPNPGQALAELLQGFEPSACRPQGDA